MPPQKTLYYLSKKFLPWQQHHLLNYYYFFSPTRYIQPRENHAPLPRRHAISSPFRLPFSSKLRSPAIAQPNNQITRTIFIWVFIFSSLIRFHATARSNPRVLSPDSKSHSSSDSNCFETVALLLVSYTWSLGHVDAANVLRRACYFKACV